MHKGDLMKSLQSTLAAVMKLFVGASASLLCLTVCGSPKQDVTPLRSAFETAKAGDTIVVRVKGDGREYVLNLYTKSRRMAFSYRAPLPTTKDEWTEVRVPLEDFIPTAFGRRVQGMGPVEPDQINGLGFMLSDKKPGKFQMQVAWVKVKRGER